MEGGGHMNESKLLTEISVSVACYFHCSGRIKNVSNRREGININGSVRGDCRVKSGHSNTFHQQGQERTGISCKIYKFLLTEFLTVPHYI